jgi:hypothetical protein
MSSHLALFLIIPIATYFLLATAPSSFHHHHHHRLLLPLLSPRYYILNYSILSVFSLFLHLTVGPKEFMDLVSIFYANNETILMFLQLSLFFSNSKRGRINLTWWNIFVFDCWTSCFSFYLFSLIDFAWWAIPIYLEFDNMYTNGLMDTLALLQSKRNPGFFVCNEFVCVLTRREEDGRQWC